MSDAALIAGSTIPGVRPNGDLRGGGLPGGSPATGSGAGAPAGAPAFLALLDQMFASRPAVAPAPIRTSASGQAATDTSGDPAAGDAAHMPVATPLQLLLGGGQADAPDAQIPPEAGLPQSGGDPANTGPGIDAAADPVSATASDIAQPVTANAAQQPAPSEAATSAAVHTASGDIAADGAPGRSQDAPGRPAVQGSAPAAAGDPALDTVMAVMARPAGSGAAAGGGNASAAAPPEMAPDMAAARDPASVAAAALALKAGTPAGAGKDAATAPPDPSAGEEASADNPVEALKQRRTSDGAPARPDTGAAQDAPRQANQSAQHQPQAQPATGQAPPPANAPPAADLPSPASLLIANETGDPVLPALRTEAPTTTDTTAFRLSVAGAPRPDVDAVALRIAHRADGGSNRFEIELDPPELGRVEVRLEFGRDGRVTTHMLVDRADTLDALLRDARALERALQAGGLKLDGGVQYELRDQSAFAQHQNGHGDPGPEGTGVSGEDTETGSPPAADATASYRQLVTSSGVDVRI